MTNVLGVLSHAETGWSFTPYNFDFRGPWGQVTKLDGPAVLVPQAQGWILLSRSSTPKPVIDVQWPTGDGSVRSTHSFQGEQLVAATLAFQGGALVAAERNGASVLHLLGANGLPKGDALEVPGTVRALTWVHDGFVVASTDGSGALHLLWLSPDMKRRHEWTMPTQPRSFALAASYPRGLLVVHSSAGGTFATTVTLDPGKGMTAAAPAKLLPTPTQVVSAGYAGSIEGSFAILDQGDGSLWAARLHDGDIRVKTIFTLRGARALSATTGYQRIYVAWSHGGKLHLTSFSALLN